MARREGSVTAPARARVGLPVVADGSRRHPILVRVADTAGACNNGCEPCVSRDVASTSTPSVAGQHVVIHDREPTLRRELIARIGELKRRGAAEVALVTNGRMLGYPALVAALGRAGLDRVIVKLFAVDAATHIATPAPRTPSRKRSPGSPPLERCPVSRCW